MSRRLARLMLRPDTAHSKQVYGGVMFDTLMLLALNGLIWGLIIALIALGLSIIFGLLDVINIAHGDFFMVGTVLSWFALEATGNFWVGFIFVPLICCV